MANPSFNRSALTVHFRAVRRRLTGLVRQTWRAIRPRPDPAPVEVMLASLWRQRVVLWRIRHSVRRLQRALGPPPGTALTVLVQQVIAKEGALAGCYHVGQGADGGRFALIRLALETNGHALTRDQLVAVLTEQYVALVMEQRGPSVLVPVTLEVSPSGPSATPLPLRSIAGAADHTGDDDSTWLHPFPKQSPRERRR